jgi:hypothetical protein
MNIYGALVGSSAGNGCCGRGSGGSEARSRSHPVVLGLEKLWSSTARDSVNHRHLSGPVYVYGLSCDHPSPRVV